MSDIVTRKTKFRQGWTSGLPETPCGYGSKMSTTKRQREWLPGIVSQYGIKTVADVGAGDLNWIKHVNWDVEYTAYDLIPRSEDVTEFDLVNEVPPKVDAILCLWVLNHLPKEQCRKALDNIKASGSKYLIMTDRPRWHDEQPEELHMDALEVLVLNQKRDNIRLIKL